MHSGWYQSSRMFLRGYTTRVNRLPTLRSSTLTKLAIVSSFTYCFLQKYIFDRRLFQIILFLPLLCIANTKRSSRSFLQFLVDRREKAWYYTTFILPSLFYFSFSFSLPPIFSILSFLFFFFFCFKSLADIAEGYAYPGDLYGKGRWMQLDPRQIRSFLLRLYERVTQSPPSLPPRSRWCC